MFDVASVTRRLPVHGLGSPLIFHQQLGSTQTLAAELAEGGAGHGTLVVADEQTGGRGRHGRHWHTPPGSAIAFSLVLRPDLRDPEARSLHLAAFNILGAVAVAEAVEALGGRPAIKWPNDVLLDERKVAGVLLDVAWVDQVPENLVLGVGVNVYTEAEPDEATVDFPSTSVEASLGSRPSREDLMVAIVGCIGARMQRLDPHGILAAANQRLAFRGREVEVGDGSLTRRGVLSAIDPTGDIVLQTAQGEQRLRGSELRLRPPGMHRG